MAESDLFSDLLSSQSSGFMQKFRYGGSFKPRAKTEGSTTTTTFEPDNDPPASFQQPADLKEGEVSIMDSAATPTEAPRFAGTAFNVDLRDYAPSFKTTRAAKSSRGGAIGGGRPMDTQEVSVAPLQKPAQFTFSQTIGQQAPAPAPAPAPSKDYSSELDSLRQQLKELQDRPAPAPAPAPRYRKDYAMGFDLLTRDISRDEAASDLQRKAGGYEGDMDRYLSKYIEVEDIPRFKATINDPRSGFSGNWLS